MPTRPQRLRDCRCSGSRAPAVRRGLFLLAGVLLLALLPLQAGAEGKFYGREASIPPHLREETVGDLEIKVIRAADASDLATWLTANRFRFDDADRSAFSSHISRGWVFVTARPAAGKETSVIGRRGMLAPLVLVFPTKQAVYPLALTATAGLPTQIDLYAFHHGRLEAGDALPMTYAGRRETSGIAGLAGMVEPKSLLAGETISEDFVTRFHGSMSAEQMKEDLVLRPASDNSEYTWKLVW